MAFSATRLICFAIISALEEDLRDSVKTEYAGAAASEILPSPERLSLDPPLILLGGSAR